MLANEIYQDEWRNRPSYNKSYDTMIHLEKIAPCILCFYAYDIRNRQSCTLKWLSHWLLHEHGSWAVLHAGSRPSAIRPKNGDMSAVTSEEVTLKWRSVFISGFSMTVRQKTTYNTWKKH